MILRRLPYILYWFVRKQDERINIGATREIIHLDAKDETIYIPLQFFPFFAIKYTQEESDK